MKKIILIFVLLMIVMIDSFAQSASVSSKDSLRTVFMKKCDYLFGNEKSDSIKLSLNDRNKDGIIDIIMYEYYFPDRIIYVIAKDRNTDRKFEAVTFDIYDLAGCIIDTWEMDLEKDIDNSFNDVDLKQGEVYQKKIK